MKKTIFLGAAMLLAIGTYLFCAGKNTQPDDTMLMASVEAMARRESPSNTGPAEEKSALEANTGWYADVYMIPPVPELNATNSVTCLHLLCRSTSVNILLTLYTWQYEN